MRADAGDVRAADRHPAYRPLNPGAGSAAAARPGLTVHPCDNYAALPELIGKTGEAMARHTHAIWHDDAGHPRPTEIDAQTMRRSTALTPSPPAHGGVVHDNGCGHQHVKPASTGTMAPVIRLDASEARNSTALATSSALPIRPIGVSRSQVSIRVRLSGLANTIGVSM